MESDVVRDTEDIPGPERGWALVAVLCVVAMLSLMAAAAQDFTLTSSRFERRVWDQARADAALDAGITRAILGVCRGNPTDPWRIDGVPRPFAFGGNTIELSIQDESGRFDLNMIDVSMLNALLRSAGLGNEHADVLADRILDWRSPSNLHSLHGATDDDYAAAGLHYHQRHGPFQTVDELRLVLGMTPQLFARIRPALTVYTHRPAIDTSVAPREALLALFAGDAQKVDTIIASRLSNGLPSEDGGVPTSQQQQLSPISLTGRFLTITATTRIAGRTSTRSVVVELTGDDKHPTITLAWR